MIKLIAGLGNPGKQYVKTRHNAGFNVLNLLAYEADAVWKNWKGQAEISSGAAGKKVILLKPSQYMNNSGQSVRSVLDYYGIAPDEMLAVSDDFSLELGAIRLRMKGSSGGHNGLESIINEIGTSSFARLRLGIGLVPPRTDAADFVLSDFTREESVIMHETYKKAAAVIKDIISIGLEDAISRVPAGVKEKER